MKTLHLTIKKKFFDMIVSGEKKEEYREVKDYWVRRLGYFVEWRMESYIPADISDSDGNGYTIINFDAVEFCLGYRPDSPTILVECKGIDIGEAVPEWSDNWKGNVFRIKLGNIIEKK